MCFSVKGRTSCLTNHDRADGFALAQQRRAQNGAGSRDPLQMPGLWVLCLVLHGDIMHMNRFSIDNCPPAYETTGDGHRVGSNGDITKLGSQVDPALRRR